MSTIKPGGPHSYKGRVPQKFHISELHLPFEPEYPPDAMYQDDYIRAITYPLRVHFDTMNLFLDPDPNGVFISSIGFICYDPDDLNVRVASDCTIAFGVNLGYIRERNAYVVHEMGKPPDFVMEVASASTAQRDTGRKRGIYQQIGIQEYWRFDPSGGRLYGQALAADRLVDGEYRPIEIITEPDGEIWGRSDVLGLSFCYKGHLLLVYDPVSRRYLLNEIEEHAAYLGIQTEMNAERARREAQYDELLAERARREAQYDELLAERARREAQYGELLAERARRESAQARVRELEEQLRRRESGDG